MHVPLAHHPMVELSQTLHLHKHLAVVHEEIKTIVTLLLMHYCERTTNIFAWHYIKWFA